MAAAPGPGVGHRPREGCGGPGAGGEEGSQPAPAQRAPWWPLCCWGSWARFSPSELLGHLTVFALAVVVGFYVITNVHHALHTPLMSVTNAISGIIVIGALLQVIYPNLLVTVLAVAGILVASINVFGGFTVTRRMLQMFRRA